MNRTYTNLILLLVVFSVLFAVTQAVSVSAQTLVYELNVWSVDNITLGPLVTTHLVLPRYADTLAIYDEYGNPLPLNITAINSTHLGVDVILPWIPAKYYVVYGAQPLVENAYNLIRYSALLNGTTPIYLDSLGDRNTITPWTANNLRLVSNTSSFYLIQRLAALYEPLQTSGLFANFTNVRGFTGAMMYVYVSGARAYSGCTNLDIRFYLNDSLSTTYSFPLCYGGRTYSLNASLPFVIPEGSNLSVNVVFNSDSYYFISVSNYVFVLFVFGSYGTYTYAEYGDSSRLPSTRIATVTTNLTSPTIVYTITQVESTPQRRTNVPVLKLDLSSTYLVSGGNQYYAVPALLPTSSNYLVSVVRSDCSVSTSLGGSVFNYSFISIPTQQLQYDPSIHPCQPAVYLIPTLNTSTASPIRSGSSGVRTNYSVVVDDLTTYVPRVEVNPQQKFYSSGQVVVYKVLSDFPANMTLVLNDVYLGTYTTSPEKPYTYNVTVSTSLLVFRTQLDYSVYNPPMPSKTSEWVVATIIPAIMAGVPDVVTIAPTTTAVINMSKPSVDVGVLAYLSGMPPEYLGALNMFILFVCITLVLVANKVSAGIAVLGVALLLTLMNTVSGAEVFNRLVVGLIALIGVLSFFTEVRS